MLIFEHWCGSGCCWCFRSVKLGGLASSLFWFVCLAFLFVDSHLQILINFLGLIVDHQFNLTFPISRTTKLQSQLPLKEFKKQTRLSNIDRLYRASKSGFFFSELKSLNSKFNIKGDEVWRNEKEPVMSVGEESKKCFHLDSVERFSWFIFLTKSSQDLNATESSAVAMWWLMLFNTINNKQEFIDHNHDFFPESCTLYPDSFNDDTLSRPFVCTTLTIKTWSTEDSFWEKYLANEQDDFIVCPWQLNKSC